MNMAEPLNFAREGRDWPHRESSRFIQAGGIRWHVQVIDAKGPSADTILLVHGTGAATHSWRDVMPLLQPFGRVIALDLPGHGFTSVPPREQYGLAEMSRALAALLTVMGASPTVLVGHSAGAAILARMCLDQVPGGESGVARHLVSVNGALLPFRGLPGEVFSPLAKMLSQSALVPRIFAWRASNPQVLNRLLDATGSQLDDSGRQLYGTVIANSRHAAAALKMMAQWDLRPLEAELPQLTVRGVALTLVVGTNDRTVSPDEAKRCQTLVPGARIETLAGLGHLAHEEAPQALADVVQRVIHIQKGET